MIQNCDFNKAIDSMSRHIEQLSVLDEVNVTCVTALLYLLASLRRYRASFLLLAQQQLIQITLSIINIPIHTSKTTVKSWESVTSSLMALLNDFVIKRYLSDYHWRVIFDV